MVVVGRKSSQVEDEDETDGGETRETKKALRAHLRDGVAGKKDRREPGRKEISHGREVRPYLQNGDQERSPENEPGAGEESQARASRQDEADRDERPERPGTGRERFDEPVARAEDLQPVGEPGAIERLAPRRRCFSSDGEDDRQPGQVEQDPARQRERQRFPEAPKARLPEERDEADAEEAGEEAGEVEGPGGRGDGQKPEPGETGARPAAVGLEGGNTREKQEETQRIGPDFLRVADVNRREGEEKAADETGDGTEPPGGDEDDERDRADTRERAGDTPGPLGAPARVRTVCSENSSGGWTPSAAASCSIRENDC